MQFQTMREFLVLAKTLNFMSAAEELYESQATLSKHIREMEKELDAKLFKRTTRKVELTELGIRMIPYARRAVQLYEEYSQEVSEYNEMMHNYLSVGWVSHWDEVDLGMLTMRFQSEHPNIHIHVTTDDSESLMGMMKNGNCDLAIVREDPDDSTTDDLSRWLICEDPLNVFLSKKHPLAASEQISLSQLRYESFLLDAAGSVSYNLAVRACKIAGFHPTIIYSGGGPQPYKYMEHGLGIGLMFGNPLENIREGQSVVCLPLEERICSNIDLVYNEGALTEPAKAFLSFVKEYKFQ